MGQSYLCRFTNPLLVPHRWRIYGERYLVSSRPSMGASEASRQWGKPRTFVPTNRHVLGIAEVREPWVQAAMRTSLLSSILDNCWAE